MRGAAAVNHSRSDKPSFVFAFILFGFAALNLFFSGAT